MAISFNFENKHSPVKETPQQCINCSHFLNYGNLIGRCSYTYDFKFNSTKFFKCAQFRDKQIKVNRAIHVSFVLMSENGDKINYIGSGLGIVVNTDMTDNDLLSKMYNDNELIREASFKLENEFNFKQPVVELVITAERLENTNWYCTNNFLLKAYNDGVIKDLNRDSSSSV